MEIQRHNFGDLAGADVSNSCLSAKSVSLQGLSEALALTAGQVFCLAVTGADSGFPP